MELAQPPGGARAAIVKELSGDPRRAATLDGGSVANRGTLRKKRRGGTGCGGGSLSGWVGGVGGLG